LACSPQKNVVRGQSRRCNRPNLIGPHKGDNQIRRQRLVGTRPRRADLIVNAFWRESGKVDRPPVLRKIIRRAANDLPDVRDRGGRNTCDRTSASAFVSKGGVEI